MGRGGKAMRYGRNSFIGLLVDWAMDKFFDWYDTKTGKKKSSGEFIKIVPNTDPDRFYHGWIKGERRSPNELPEIQLTITKSDKSIDELVQLICSQKYLQVFHTGHSEETCPGVTLSEGLMALLGGQPSSWQIRTATPGLVEYTEPNLVTLDLFLAQEFEGSEPGHPNRDICDISLNRDLGPMELELRIPHYGVRDGYCKVVYLKVDFRIDPVKGVIVTGHEDNMDSRPR